MKLVSPLEVMLDEYLQYVLIEQHLTINTKKSYENDLNQYCCYLKDKKISDVRDIKTSDIVEYLKILSDGGIAPQSVAHAITSIKNFHEYFVKTGVLERDVSKNIERPKLRKQLPSTLTVDEVDKLLDVVTVTPFDYRNKAMLELLYGTGLRISELLSLTLNDVDVINCTLRCMGKGRKERIIPINDYIIDSLRDYLEVRSSLCKGKEFDKLFLNNHGKPITRQGFFKILKKLLLVK